MAKNTPTKLNLGAGWWKPLPGWTVVDHVNRLWGATQAWDIPYADKAFEVVFCSHMIEHVSHFKIEQVLSEINRVMRPGGVLRLLTPDLKKLARAYVENDVAAMDKYIEEDGGGVQRDLGLGQAFLGFIVSPGYDNVLCDSQLSTPIAGYAHVYCYDYEMLSGLLARYGFGSIRECDIDDSKIPEHKKLRAGRYDADKRHSLIVEAIKEKDVAFDESQCLMHRSCYDIARIPKAPQFALTRAVMKGASAVNTLLYRTAKSVASKLSPATHAPDPAHQH